ncbi:MAG: hypothetical protein M1834_006207 [Cirrosporium novae-zelandiae]|nr:MAG: hypothetical protein M1834_006207 [Cirrosporium novae-zelandiae]
MNEQHNFRLYQGLISGIGTDDWAAEFTELPHTTIRTVEIPETKVEGKGAWSCQVVAESSPCHFCNQNEHEQDAAATNNSIIITSVNINGASDRDRMRKVYTWMLANDVAVMDQATITDHDSVKHDNPVRKVVRAFNMAHFGSESSLLQLDMIFGQARTEKGGYSLYNWPEVFLAVDIVKGLLSNKSKFLTETGFDNVEVSNVDDFLGREHKCIIFTVVATPGSYYGPNIFIRNPNQLCVAVSRAKNGLWIIGKLQSLDKGKEENAMKDVIYYIRNDKDAWSRGLGHDEYIDNSLAA